MKKILVILGLVISLIGCQKDNIDNYCVECVHANGLVTTHDVPSGNYNDAVWLANQNTDVHNERHCFVVNADNK